MVSGFVFSRRKGYDDVKEFIQRVTAPNGSVFNGPEQTVILLVEDITW